MSVQRDPVQVIAALPGKVALPPQWSGFFDKRGAVPIQPDDQRRYPRFYFRTVAGLTYVPSLPNLARPTESQRVLVKDISRGSAAFLHSEQLFPRELVKLLLIDGVERLLEVTRCRRIQADCFEVGAKFANVE